MMVMLMVLVLGQNHVALGGELARLSWSSDQGKRHNAEQGNREKFLHTPKVSKAARRCPTYFPIDEMPERILGLFAK